MAREDAAIYWAGMEFYSVYALGRVLSREKECSTYKEWASWLRTAKARTGKTVGQCERALNVFEAFSVVLEDLQEDEAIRKSALLDLKLLEPLIRPGVPSGAVVEVVDCLVAGCFLKKVDINLIIDKHLHPEFDGHIPTVAELQAMFGTDWEVKPNPRRKHPNALTVSSRTRVKVLEFPGPTSAKGWWQHQVATGVLV